MDRPVVHCEEVRLGKESAFRAFEDFRVGARFVAAPRALAAGDRGVWAGLSGDPTPRFVGPEGWIHPVHQLALTHSAMVRLLAGQEPVELGFSHLQLHRALRAGGALSVSCRVIGARADTDEASGVVWVRVAGRDDRGVVLAYVHWFRVAKRHRQSAGAAGAPPDLGPPPDVPEALARTIAPSVGAAASVPPPFRFRDYVAGERIYHQGARYLASSELRAFARAFQHDGLMHQLPDHSRYRALGTHLVGVAYALGYDGLQGRIGLGALVALRLPHPVPPDRTLRAMSQVTEARALGSSLGALRLRTFLFVDRLPMADDPPLIHNGQRYHDHIALDMDYWELVTT